MYRTLTIALLLILTPLLSQAQRWKQVALPAPYDKGYYLDIYFLPSNPQLGWACDNDSGYVVRTTNGGASWTGTRIGTPGQRCHLEYIQFFSNNVGYSSGPCGVYKSLDGGATWTQVTLPSPAIGVWGAWFRDANEGWVTGGGCGFNRFLRTMDGGQTFSEFIDTNIKRSNLSDPIWQADMAAGRLYAIGNGTLWKSDDDGLTWGVQSYTGANSPWHEEIAKSGNTFMIPNAQSNCATGGYTGGGVRTSIDNGQTWTEFNIGEDMFGTFLLSEQKGWAAGWAANVWYTSNAGTSWSKRDCGLNGANTDDLYMFTDTTGWVVGKGLFHLAPPLRTLSDSLVVFLATCPDSSRYDTVWVENINFNSSVWSSKFVGPEEYMFRVANILPPSLPPCSRTPIIIEYRALVPGAHNASLVISIERPDTVLVVDLRGSQRSNTATPSDTLIEFNQRAGTTGNRVLNWQSTASPSEIMTEIVAMRGDTNIQMTATLPMVVPVAPIISQTFIEATPQDTGWISTRFRVVFDPCGRDTFVTVRVYGESPIINSVTNASLDAKCRSVDTLRIPFSNTGNLPLKVLAIRFEGLGAPPFRMIGYSSGRAQLNYALPVGEADTILIEYVRVSGNDAADLVIENDDLTTTRGVVSTWRVALSALSSRPSFAITPMIIDLGDMCAGLRSDTNFTVSNTSQSAISVATIPSSSRFSGLSGSASSVGARSDRIFRFQWTPDRAGRIEDTLLLRIQPCDTASMVIVRANVLDGGVKIIPSPLRDSVPVGDTVRQTISISMVGGDSVVIVSVDHLPVGNTVKLGIPQVPFTLRDGITMNITVEWTSPIVARSQTQLVVTTIGSCGSVAYCDIDLSTYTDIVKLSKDSIALHGECLPKVMFDTVRVQSIRNTAIRMSRPLFVPPYSMAVSVVTPLADVVIPPMGSQDVIVRYDPTIAKQVSETLRLQFPDDATELLVPLTASYSTTEVSVVPSSIDADTLATCDSIRLFPITISNSGDKDEIVDVNTSRLLPGFTVSPTSVIISANASSIVTLRVDPSAIATGINSCTVEFTGRTCGVSHSVIATVVGTGGRLNLTPDPSDAGTIPVGQSMVLPVSISNPTTTPRRVVSLTVSPTLSAWTILDDVTGLVLDPGQSRTVNVQFQALSVGDASTRLVLVDAERCTTVSSIALIGKGRDPDAPPDHVLQLRVDRYAVPPESYVHIPVFWDSDVSLAQVQGADIRLGYRYLNLTVDSVTVGTMPDVSVVSEFDQGEIRFTITNAGPQCGMAGSIGVIHGVAHSALPDSTDLAFTYSQVVSAEPVSVEIKNGVLIVDACGPRNPIIFTSPTSIVFLPPHPTRDVIYLRVDAPYRETLRVEAISVLGDRQVLAVDVVADKGESVIAVPVSLQTGTYILRVTTGRGGEFTAPRLIVR